MCVTFLFFSFFSFFQRIKNSSLTHPFFVSKNSFLSTDGNVMIIKWNHFFPPFFQPHHNPSFISTVWITWWNRNLHTIVFLHNVKRSNSTQIIKVRVKFNSSSFLIDFNVTHIHVRWAYLEIAGLFFLFSDHGWKKQNSILLEIMFHFNPLSVSLFYTLMSEYLFHSALLTGVS